MNFKLLNKLSENFQTAGGFTLSDAVDALGTHAGPGKPKEYTPKSIREGISQLTNDGYLEATGDEWVFTPKAEQAFSDTRAVYDDTRFTGPERDDEENPVELA